ncbi:MAG: DUF1638 domain-containing protein [Chloroflexi bacterium]|jgi:hypothetical protein|nr:DUF1638 domain-containing protein [Chloroflexota bacterium]HQD91554.1 DUF1638 domain-containing protein [Syntrophomonadaceae bacterium]
MVVRQYSKICLACESLKEEISKLAPKCLKTKFYAIGLHESPAFLNKALQQDILEEGCGRDVLLAYGFCSRSTIGLFNPGGRLVLPRFHDCIQLLRRVGEDATGSYFLSPSWVRYGRTPLQERQQLIEKYGRETGEWIFDSVYRHYRRIIYIDTMNDGETVNETLYQARETARRLQWDFMVEQGTVDRLERLLKGCWESADFLVLAPGQKVEESMFFK